MIDGFSQFEDLIAAIDAADTQGSVTSVVLDHIKSLGFNHCTYDLIRPPKGQSHTHFTNYPDEYVERYIANRYARFDIMANYAATTLRPFSWTEISKKVHPTKDQTHVRDEGCEFGLKNVAMIPVHGPGAKAYVSISNDMPSEEFEKLFIAKRHELQLLAAYAHERILELNSKAEGKLIARLTPREAEVLTWAALGKSNWDVAQILGIAESTVKDHLQKTFEKLGVKSKAHATAVAIGNGLISL